MGKKSSIPRRPRVDKAQDVLWNWVVHKYFDYLDEKKKLGGYPNEFELRVLSSVMYAPEIEAADILRELLRQYAVAIWRLDPAKRPDEDAEEEADGADDGTVEPVAADTTRTETSKVSAEGIDEVANDLFSVAGVTMPPSFTMADANVIDGFRRVLRRHATLRIMQLDLRVREMKTAESIKATNEQIEAVARVAARVLDPDDLLWNYRDQKVQPDDPSSPRPWQRPSA